MTKPHVVYLAAAFPPAPTGGVGRAIGTAQALTQGGFDLTVLTLEDSFWAKYFGIDNSLVGQIPPEAQVIKTAFEWPDKDGDLRNWPADRLQDPIRWLKTYRESEQSVFPEGGYGFLSHKWMPAMREIHKTKPIDLVVATGNPYSSFQVAHEFFKESNVPYVLDYRDAWTLNQFTGEEKYGKGTRQGALEETYISNAAQVWFVNSATENWHLNQYPNLAGRSRTVTNAWDLRTKDSENTRQAHHRSRRFGWIGTVTNQVSMSEFEQGWQTAIDSGLAGVSAHIYDANSQYQPGLCKGMGEEEPGFIYGHARLSKNDVVQTYASFDALLFIAPGGKYVTTGKIFELLATGRPIISIHDPQLAAVELLRDYPLWFNAGGLDPQSIAHALVEANQFLDNPDSERVKLAREYGNSYRRDLVMAPPIAELRSWFPENVDVV